MGKTGIKAVNTPLGVDPKPIAAVSHRLASVQFRESIPWLVRDQYPFGLGPNLDILKELA